MQPNLKVGLNLAITLLSLLFTCRTISYSALRLITSTSLDTGFPSILFLNNLLYDNKKDTNTDPIKQYSSLKSSAL